MLNETEKKEIFNKKISNQYIIKEWFKDGGLSSIFYGKDLKNENNNILIKVVKINLINDTKFFDEIKIYKNITYNNTNIVKIFDYSIDENYFYLILEKLNGITLDEFINKNKILTWSEIKYIILQIINAIKTLHLNPKGQIIHRDIKPQNIIIDSNFQIKLIDFGISTLQNQNKILTKENDLFCSPFYSCVDILELSKEVRSLVSEEQINKFNKIVSPQLDIHPIAIIMYELIMNRLPFEEMYNNAISQLNKIKLWTKRDIPKISNIRFDIPPELDKILLKATASTLDNIKLRYRSIIEFENDILNLEFKNRTLPKEIFEKENNFIDSKIFKNKKIIFIIFSIIVVLILLIIIIITYGTKR